MFKLIMLLAMLLVAGCFFNRVSHNQERTNEVMITFVQRAQAGFWKDAMANVTPSEREEMMDDGQVLTEYREAVSRIRLSTIKNMELGLDSKGRLVGLLDILDESNSLFRASEEKVVIDPSKLEDLSVQRKKKEEEDRKKFEESMKIPETSEWDEYYSTNKRRKRFIDTDTETEPEPETPQYEAEEY